MAVGQMKAREVVRATEAGNILGVSPKSIQRWADAGLIRPIARTRGKHRRFTRTELERFRSTTLGDPRCPHCGKSLATGRIRKIKLPQVATKRNENRRGTIRK
jgi:excisionase family DNA binding protein